MNHADRLALLAFLRARLRDGGDEGAAAALRGVIDLAETAFTDDEEWSLVPDPVAQTVPSALHLRLLSATGAATACAAAVVGFASTVPRSGEPASAAGFAAAFLLLAGALWITVAGSQANFAVVGLPLWAHW
ncbi:hypothetical protein [Phytomonospora endophytica]|uniref:Uncharacterized protein n=1 Tax=Phytomonospora endophytica TaxID=714109 RepID=A0A841FNH8_9ACTN|nr:hypothetical protein [Phytomonospora endophytica]MBB6035112.1 hypothetical protein [Phytomonospora endophytica]GIG64140.1 hypothetical protein Pen01_04350 [Phytomonospora endophytica]